MPHFNLDIRLIKWFATEQDLPLIQVYAPVHSLLLMDREILR